jgi:hypothetical protein
MEYTLWQTRAVSTAVSALIGRRGATVHFAAPRRTALKAQVSKQNIWYNNLQAHISRLTMLRHLKLLRTPPENALPPLQLSHFAPGRAAPFVF